MDKILISGYYGFDNAGDDSVLYGIIHSIYKQNPNIQLGVLSNKPEKTEKMFGISAYNRWNFAEVTKQIKEHDLLLMGGGSLLQDATSPRSVLYYLGIVTVAKFYRKPVVFFAQGVGPISKRLSKKLIQLVVNKVDVITVRDHKSGEDLAEFGVTKAPIIVTADPAVTISPNKIDLSIGNNVLNQYKINNGKKMIISVRSWKRESQYKQRIAQIADYYAEKGWHIIFVPMQYPSDLSPSKDIVKQMKQQATIIDQPLNFKEIMSMIGNSDFILGMRLHSIIFAAVMNIPFLALSYDPKIDRFAERLNMYSVSHIKNIDIHETIQNINAIIDNPQQIKDTLSKKIVPIIQSAEKSSQLTMEQLHKK